MKGVCIDDSMTTVLVAGETYFLVPHGSENVYVSRFPRSGSHFGCFQKSRFELVNETVDLPNEPTAYDMSDQKVIPVLQDNRIYKARLFTNPKNYPVKLGIYYISQTTYLKKPSKTDCYFYSDPKLQKFEGRFPIAWFTDFEEITSDAVTENEPKQKEVELPKDHWEQLDLFSI